MNITTRTKRRSRRFFVPFSLALLPLAGGAYLIQTISVMGVVLMMVGAMTWPALLVGMSLMGIAIEAIVGVVSRWWILLPVLVLAGYETFAAVEHVQAWGEQRAREIDQNRQNMKMPAGGRSLVFQSKSSSLPSELVEGYQIDATYEIVSKPGDPARYMSYRLIPHNRCRDLPAATEGHTVNVTWIHVNMFGAQQLDSGACRMAMTDVPPNNPIMIEEQVDEADPQKPQKWMDRTLRISSPDGHQAVIRTGVSHPLSWAPFFLAGCGLNSSNPSWDCFFRMARDTVGDAYGLDARERLAAILDLQARKPGEVPSIDVDAEIAAAARRLEVAHAKEDALATSLLEGVLKDASYIVPDGAIAALADNARVTGPRLLQMEEVMNQVRSGIHGACTSTDAACRSSVRNAAAIRELLQWQISASRLDAAHRTELKAIRRRMRQANNKERRQAYEKRMEGSQQRVISAMRNRHLP